MNTTRRNFVRALAAIPFIGRFAVKAGAAKAAVGTQDEMMARAHAVVANGIPIEPTVLGIDFAPHTIIYLRNGDRVEYIEPDFEPMMEIARRAGEAAARHEHEMVMRILQEK